MSSFRGAVDRIGGIYHRARSRTGEGTLLLDFSTSGGGYAFAKYSAEGKFSVGVNSACLVP